MLELEPLLGWNTDHLFSFEVKKASAAILQHPLVLEAVKKLGLPDDAIVQADPWMYGADRYSDGNTPKLLQSLLYARAPHNHPESNQYAFPLPISALYDINLEKVIRIDPLASGGKEDGLAYHTGGSKPLEHCVENEYYHEILKAEPRKDLKPLQIVQPDGPSFTVTDGNCVSWQKWRFRVGFNYREGLTLHDIRYDKRPVFYRLSVSEMTVPYGGTSGTLRNHSERLLTDSIYQIHGVPTTANKLSILVMQGPAAPVRPTVIANSRLNHRTMMFSS